MKGKNSGPVAYLKKEAIFCEPAHFKVIMSVETLIFAQSPWKRQIRLEQTHTHTHTHTHKVITACFTAHVHRGIIYELQAAVILHKIQMCIDPG